MAIQKVITIGAYGFSEQDFFNALLKANVDTFCDIRLRRGMRGPKYSFANKTYLENKLNYLGIKYIHFKNLAPTKEIRINQQLEDKKNRVQKSSRNFLAESFIQAYKNKILFNFNCNEFIKETGENSKIIALFCVEKTPHTCHRSLVMEKLINDLGVIGENLLP